MKEKRNRKMKKIVSLVMAILLFLSLTGCGNSGDKPVDDKSATTGTLQNSTDIKSAVPDTRQNSADNKDGGVKPSAAPTEFTAQQSYTAYIEAKSELASAITDALGDNPDYSMESMALLGMVMADMAIIPAAYLGLGQDATATGLAMFGVTDVKYTENGNLYTVTYKSQNGETYELQAEYDPAADALVCEVTSGGEDEGIYYEYRKAPFGYVGQIYFFESDAVTESYHISVHENGGVIGIFESGKRPAALTGGEAKDFPKACPRWYAMDGATGTGVTGAGEEFSFEYVNEEQTEYDE